MSHIYFPFYPEILLLDIYPGEMKTGIHKETCTRMLIEALFIMAPNKRFIFINTKVKRQIVIYLLNRI